MRTPEVQDRPRSIDAPPAVFARSVLAVLVVYRRPMSEVAPWSSILRILDAGEPLNPDSMPLRHVLIYDNSPLAMAAPSPNDPRIGYVHDSSNGGTSAAYRHAAGLASRLKIDWLWLLDHDTVVPDGMLRLAALCLAKPEYRQAKALVPLVFHGEKQISPAVISNTATVTPLRGNRLPAVHECITAVASGAMIDAATLLSLPQMPPALWLDYVDHWIFVHLHRQRSLVAIVDCRLQHDLSIAAPGSLSRERMVSLFEAQRSFLAIMPLRARLMFPLRILRFIARTLFANPRRALDAVAWSFTPSKR